MDKLHKRLRDLREDLDLTQTQLGSVLGTTKEQYYKYEKGVQAIPVRHLITLAKLYKTSLDYITGLTDDPKPPKKD